MAIISMPPRMVRALSVPQHGPHASFDGAMILLDPVVEILALPGPDRLRPSPRSIPQAAGRIAGHDGGPVSLAAVDDDPLGTPVTLKGLLHEPLGGAKVALLAEIELHCVADAVDGAIQIHPATAHLDVGLIDMPFARQSALAKIEPPQEFRRITDHPAMDRRMINADAALGHHFFEIPQAQSVGEIPAHAQKDNRTIKMAATEHPESPKTGPGL
jgi:hypothetical protein